MAAFLNSNLKPTSLAFVTPNKPLCDPKFQLKIIEIEAASSVAATV